jgi:hypothetical protein
LIKQYEPRYNIRLKDDESYLSVKVTLRDAWPRVLVPRKIVKDGGKYSGPYASACPSGVPSGAAVDITLIVHAVNNAANDCSS